MPKNRYDCRWMVKRDMPEVLEIEAGSFAAPWSMEDFLEALRERNCIGMVVDRDDVILGFMLYQLEKDHLLLLNMAVCPDHRLRGVGKAMVAKLRSKLSGHRRTHILADVNERNLEAQLFFKAEGFLATDTLRRHYPSGDDAYRFEFTHMQATNPFDFSSEDSCRGR